MLGRGAWHRAGRTRPYRSADDQPVSTERPGPLEVAPVTIYRAERVVTLDGGDAEALVVGGDRVLARGSWSGARAGFPGAAVVELDGVVIPGLQDAHTHLALTVEDRLHLDLSPDVVRSRTDLLALLGREAGRTPPGCWLRASRYSDAGTQDRPLSRWDLDAVTGQVPTLVVHIASHWGVANSAALALAGLDDDATPPPGGEFGRDGGGRLTGVLFEQALFDFAFPAVSRTGSVVVPPSGAADRLAALGRVVEQWHAAGLTAICDAMVGPEDLRLFQEARRRGLLTLRTGMLIAAQHYDLVRRLGLRSGLGDDGLRVVGVKAFVDGAVAGRTCLTDAPHAGRQDHGIQSTPTGELREIVRAVHDDGNRLGVHANGDRAIRLLLDLLEEAAEQAPRPGLRHRVEHCSMVDDDIVRRLRSLDAIVVPFGSYVHFYGQSLIDWYGEELVQRMFAHASLLRAGVTVAGSSDHPCGPYEPLLAVQSCVTRTGRDGVPVGVSQRVSVTDALRCYTVGAAEATGEADRQGRLAPGYLADFVVLGADPRRVPESSIGAIPVRSTWVGGRRVWPVPDPEGPTQS